MGGKRGRGRTDFKFCVQTICGLKTKCTKFQVCSSIFRLYAKKIEFWTTVQCAVFYLIYRNIFMLLRQRETWKSSMVQYLPRAHHNFSKKYPHWKVLSSCRQFFDMSTSFVIPITQCKQL